MCFVPGGWADHPPRERARPATSRIPEPSGLWSQSWVAWPRGACRLIRRPAGYQYPLQSGDPTSLRSSDCHRPNAATPDADGVGNPGLPVHSSAGSERCDDALPSNGQSAADPPPASGGPCSSGSTIGTSLEGRPDAASPLRARPTTAGWHPPQRNSANSLACRVRAWPG